VLNYYSSDYKGQTQPNPTLQIVTQHTNQREKHSCYAMLEWLSIYQPIWNILDMNYLLVLCYILVN